MSLVSYPLSEREAELTLFDTSLFPFLMEIMLKNTSYQRNKIIKTRSTSASFPPVTVKWTSVKFVLKSLLYTTIKIQLKRGH